MSNRDRGMIGLLIILAIFIWSQDLSWLSEAEDTLPILATLPLFVWLGLPWRFRTSASSFSSGGLVTAIFGFLLGGITGSTLLFALGWSALLWSWLAARIEPSDRQNLNRLMILPLMAFPWIALDGQMIGWWFRLSGSRVAGTLFSSLGFNVVQEGTRLLVQGLPIEVTAACSGLNTLQAMIIAGSTVAYITLGNHPAYWLNLMPLLLLSWMANTLRIIAICWAAVTFSPAFAAGFFHQWGGGLVLFLMFSLCLLIFTLERALLNQPKEAVI